MGGTALLGLLYTAIDRVQSFVDVFIFVYILLILVYVILSWIRLPYSTWGNRIQRFLADVCEPYIRLFRRILPQFGPLDLSPMVAVIALVVLRSVLDAIFARLD